MSSSRRFPGFTISSRRSAKSDWATSRWGNPRRRFQAARRSASSSQPSSRDVQPGGPSTCSDEPTTGLHFADIHKLLEVLQRLVQTGNTVLVIEHNLDVIKTADYLIDLGPEGGDRGGRVVGIGTPEELAANPASYTGAYLVPVRGPACGRPSPARCIRAREARARKHDRARRSAKGDRVAVEA